MNNVLPIGSANIINFGFQSTFNTEAKTLFFDITGLTAFAAGGIANVPGICFNVTGPGGLPIIIADWTAPNIVPASASTFSLALPSVYALFGWYTIQGLIKDQDGTIYFTPVIRKEITKPDGYQNSTVPGSINLDANCDIPQLLISENSITVYKNLAPIANVKTGTLSYPRGTIADLSFSVTPFIVKGSGQVFTGRYTINSKNVASFDLGDGVIVKVTFAVTSYEKVVDCQSALTRIICCIDDYKKRYESDPYSANGKAAMARLERVSLPLVVACVKERAGVDASFEVDQISRELKCDCGCGTMAIEPKPILATTSTGTIISVTGTHASHATQSITGGTTTFSIDTKFEVVTKPVDDLSFDIVKTETDSNINYSIVFNYTNLASTILNTIKDNDTLLALFRSLFDDIGVEIDLSGLNGSCIGLDLGAADYTLVEQNANGKLITSVTIDATPHAAPDNLSATNTVSLLSWLNGLSLGVFTASYDSTSKSLVIQSANNSHRVNTLSVSTSGTVLIRQFISNGKSIKQLVQFIFDYLCTLDTSKVKTGLDMAICSFAANGATISTNVPAGTSLSMFLSVIAKAQCDLVAKVAGLLKVDCASISSLFAAVPATVSVDPVKDLIYGKVNNACTAMTFDQFLTASLTRIGSVQALKTLFCAIASTCSVPVCDAPTNVGGNLLYGDANLDITNIVGSVDPA